jgi:hypothetical protein
LFFCHADTSGFQSQVWFNLSFDQLENVFIFNLFQLQLLFSMMAVYSSFFSSGLLAPYPPRSTNHCPPSSPMPMPSSPIDPVDRGLSTTPTPSGTSNNIVQAPTANVDRPPMRRRRSSINIAAHPMALIKSPTRNAGFALQRTGVMSPTRSRAGSLAEGASDSNSLFGRLRSGSLNAGAQMR